MPPNKPQPNQPNQQKLTSEQQNELTSLVSKITGKLDSLLANSEVSTTIAKQQQVQQTQQIVQNLPPQQAQPLPTAGTQQTPHKPQPTPGSLPTTQGQRYQPQQGPQQPTPLGKATQQQVAAQNPFLMTGFFRHLTSTLTRVFQMGHAKSQVEIHEAKSEYHTTKAGAAKLPELIKQHQAKVYHTENRLAKAQAIGKGIPKAFANYERAQAGLEKVKAKVAAAPLQIQAAQGKLDKASGVVNPRDALSSGFGHLRDAFTNQPGHGAGSMQSLFKAAGNIASIFGRGGKVVQGVTLFGEQIFKGVDNLQKMNQQMHDFDMQFAMFSGSMAMVMAEQRVRDIQLAHTRGERLAPTARLREQSGHQLNVEMAKISDGFSSIKNLIAFGQNKLFETILKFSGIPRIMERLNDAINRFLGDQSQIPGGDWLDDFGQTFGNPQPPLTGVGQAP